VLSLNELRVIATAAHAVQTLLIIDEAYYPFHPTTALDLVREFDNVVVTRTFSKVGGLAGLRLGYFIAQPPIPQDVDHVRGAHEVNAMALHVGARILDHPEIGQAFVQRIEAGRAVLLDAAAAVGIHAPSCPANFQLLELNVSLNPSRVVQELKDRGYLVKGGFTHPSVVHCIRVTLDGPDVMKGFVQALREVVSRAVV